MRQQGYRAVFCFVVLHSNIQHISIAEHIDIIYALLLEKALEIGIEVICYKTIISTQTIQICHSLPFIR